MSNPKIIDGKKIARQICQKLKEELDMLQSSRYAGLAFILIGDDEASQIYVKMKARRCKQIGINSQIIRLKTNTSELELSHEIDTLNKNSNIHGILVQQPMPAQINTTKICSLINPAKDVDGFHPYNLGKLFYENPHSQNLLAPCTPLACLRLLTETQTNPRGKKVCIIGRSIIVGKPLALMLAQNGVDATVRLAHSRTKELAATCRDADIIISAVGKANLIKGDMLKKNAVVLDVGINRLPNGKLCGDVDFENALPNVKKITPVPGGVGPMTIAMLMQNTLRAFKNIEKLR